MQGVGVRQFGNSLPWITIMYVLNSTRLVENEDVQKHSGASHVWPQAGTTGFVNRVKGRMATKTRNIRIKYLKPTSDGPSSSSRLFLGHQFFHSVFWPLKLWPCAEMISPRILPEYFPNQGGSLFGTFIGPPGTRQKSLSSHLPPAKALPLRPTPKPSFLLLEVDQPSNSFLLRSRWSKLMASARLLTRPLASLHSLMMGVTLVSLTTPVLLSSCCRRWQPPACKHPNKRPSLDDSPPN